MHIFGDIGVYILIVVGFLIVLQVLRRVNRKIDIYRKELKDHMNASYLILHEIRDRAGEPKMGVSDEFLKKD
tara:strand:- start:214 stop:429 length:216 start_codon:yes stop_codon:yes gene_type:complete